MLFLRLLQTTGGSVPSTSGSQCVLFGYVCWPESFSLFCLPWLLHSLPSLPHLTLKLPIPCPPAPETAHPGPPVRLLCCLAGSPCRTKVRTRAAEDGPELSRLGRATGRSGRGRALRSLSSGVRGLSGPGRRSLEPKWQEINNSYWFLGLRPMQVQTAHALHNPLPLGT